MYLAVHLRRTCQIRGGFLLVYSHTEHLARILRSMLAQSIYLSRCKQGSASSCFHQGTLRWTSQYDEPQGASNVGREVSRADRRFITTSLSLSLDYPSASLTHEEFFLLSWGTSCAAQPSAIQFNRYQRKHRPRSANAIPKPTVTASNALPN